MSIYFEVKKEDIFICFFFGRTGLSLSEILRLLPTKVGTSGCNSFILKSISVIMVPAELAIVMVAAELALVMVAAELALVMVAEAPAFNLIFPITLHPFLLFSMV